MNRRVYKEHFCECRFFWSFCFSLFLLLFIPLSDLFLSPSPTMNLIITHYFDIPLCALAFMLFHGFLRSLLACVDPPPILLYHIITMSPRGPTSAPCIFLMREIGEEATTVSSQRRQYLQTGLEPVTSTFTSQTGSPLPSSPSWMARTLQIQPDPEMHPRDDPQKCEICVWMVFSVQIPSLASMNTQDSSRTERAAVAVSRLSKQLGRMGSLRNSSTKPQQCVGSVTLKGWISYWNQSHEGCLKCAFYTK